jgi:hypothetical protein
MFLTVLFFQETAQADRKGEDNISKKKTKKSTQSVYKSRAKFKNNVLPCMIDNCVMNAPYGLSRPDKLTEHLIKVVRIDYV